MDISMPEMDCIEGASKNLERMARAAIVRPNEAERNGLELGALYNENEVVLEKAVKARIRQIASVVIALLLVVVTGVLLWNLKHRERAAMQEHGLYEKRIEDLPQQQEIR